MKTIRTTLLCCFLLVLNITSFAQELLDKVPSTKEEFVASEKKVINTINWLENTPLGTEDDKRKSQSALFIAWVSGAPTVSLEINANVLPFTEKNKDLLIIFMAGATKYCLENSYSSDAVKYTTAGIKSAIKVYKKGMSIQKDKAMEKIIKTDESGGLEKWVREQLAKK
ncbi:MAG TPA: hypothetical protein VFF27_18135 [Bacteroidia bacterium]|jgi:hypothetical protein|nr:hypothetical protein [Bacteroidia bacterium]